MQKYELTIVLDKKTTPAKKKSVQEKVEKSVEVAGGKVGKIEDWGEKEAGIYLHFPLELETSIANNLSAKIKSEEEIIRYLLIRKD